MIKFNNMLLREEREKIVEYGKKLIDSGLTTGTGGNISIFDPVTKLMCITPSGVPYHEIEAKDVVVLDLDCNVVEGHLKPSSEKEMHAIVYRERSGLNAMVHTHSKFAAALSTLRVDLPAIDYLVAFGGGKNVRVAEYATFGSKELAINALKAMENRNAVLLANHGLNVCGPDLDTAYSVTEQIEFCCELYLRALSTGKQPVVLDDQEMEKMVGLFVTYGQ